MIIFKNGYLSEFLIQKKLGISGGISRIISQIDGNITDDLFKKNTIDTVNLEENRITTTKPEEIMIDSRGNPYTFESGPQKVKGLLITFIIPFSGDSNILLYSPSKSFLGLPRGELKTNLIELSYQTIEKDPAKIKASFENDLKLIKEMTVNINTEINDYNTSLESFIKAEVSKRNNELTKNDLFNNGLGYPIS